MINLPSPIKVGPYDYQVIHWDTSDASGHDKMGECNHCSQVIRVVTDRNPPVIVDTLIHELLHAAYYVGNFHEKAWEEYTVTTLSTQLTGIFRDNPHLLEWIQWMLHKNHQGD